MPATSTTPPVPRPVRRPCGCPHTCWHQFAERPHGSDAGSQGRRAA